MPKSKYRFNPESLSFVREHTSIRKKIGRVATYLSASIVVAVLYYIVFSLFFDTPSERGLKREKEELLVHFELLNGRFEQVNAVMEDLQKRDDNIYRVIFEAEPIPSTIREAGIGGIDRYSELEGLSNSNIVIETAKKLDLMAKKAYIQSKSLDELENLAKRKDEMLRSIPAIQPISNKDLKRIASSFGMRIHPFYKVPKMHTGMDFTAPTGTDIYATGDGVVQKVDHSQRGYGNHVVVDHGFGYSTLYAHMHSIAVRPGQKVKRGAVIGQVGNTGMSVAPHLHYEVHKAGKHINPINYFFNDLTPEQYEKVIELSSLPTQSFD
ncbi:MAG: M23 family metallopeptidase [Bacteroidales bacterium]|nr:M23 family metallopeptidase [Bacteroidales bacterium]MBN2750771.1 M23 family metallopeptidase [Bacteroidales bacterium]